LIELPAFIGRTAFDLQRSIAEQGTLCRGAHRRQGGRVSGTQAVFWTTGNRGLTERPLVFGPSYGRQGNQRSGESCRANLGDCPALRSRSVPHEFRDRARFSDVRSRLLCSAGSLFTLDAG